MLPEPYFNGGLQYLIANIKQCRAVVSYCTWPTLVPGDVLVKVSVTILLILEGLSKKVNWIFKDEHIRYYQLIKN